MKSFQSALSAPKRSSRRAPHSTVSGLVPVGMALVPLAVMTWAIMETGAGLA